MLASAEPSAKLRLVCSLFFTAALKAAMPSGRRTIAAMITPTRDLGAPTYKTDFSIAGASVLANKTTTPRHSNSNAALISEVLNVGLTGMRFSSSILRAIKNKIGA